MKVFLSGKYIEEYSKVIEKDKIYTKEETNNIFEKYGDAFVTFVTNEDENLGLDIINALSAYKERSDLILKTLEYKSADRYKKWLVKNGYQLVTVSELMAVKGIDVKAGELYTKAY